MRIDPEQAHQCDGFGACAEQQVLSVGDREVPIADPKVDAPGPAADRRRGIHQRDRGAQASRFDCARQARPARPDDDPVGGAPRLRRHRAMAPPRGGPKTQVRQAISSLRTGVSAMR